MSKKILYLDCPFSEKDQVKALGARWDKAEGKLFVPPERYGVIETFNQWRPNSKIYLNCPFEQKDQAKEAGAKWDSQLKRWYVSQKGATSSVPAKFSQWIAPNSSIKLESDVPSSQSNTHTPKKTNTPKGKRGNKKDAALLRITETMTVAQLQDECRYRNIKGLSGKNKDWMLQQLELGSIWQSADTSSKSKPVVEKTPTNTKVIKKASTSKEEDKKVSKAKNSSTNHCSSQTTPAKATSVKMTTKKVEAPKISTTKTTATTKITVATSKKATPAPKVRNSKQVDLVNLPRISDALTVTQLTHELLHRDPNTKGISNKPKQWFLEQLGESSIWTTSPDVSMDFTKLLRVSKSMTVSQIVHELMTRVPTSKGLSNKSKDDLLKLLGDGSIWTTSLNDPSGGHEQVKKIEGQKLAKAPKSSLVSKKETPVKKVAPTKLKLAAPKLAAKTKSTPSVPRTKTEKISSAPTKEKKSVGLKKSINNETMPSPSEQTPKLEKKKKAAKKPSVVPSHAPSSSSIPIASAATKSSSIPEVTRSAKVVPSDSSTAVSSQAKRPSTVASSDPTPTKKIKFGSIPYVHSTMSVAQLREELKARDPNVRGISGKGKDWLLDCLGEGTELRGSAQYRAKVDSKAAALHVHQSRCHIHLLADSSVLRPPSRLGVNVFLKKRANCGTCDVALAFICRQTPYRTCEACDYDICRPCFEIESLPPVEREVEMQKRYAKMTEENDAMQRSYEERERAEEERRLRDEREWERRQEERREELYGDELKLFPANIKKPSARNKDERNKLKYTVWTQNVHRKQTEHDVDKDFDSSYASLDDANLRVEYVFYYENPWECDKDQMYVDEDKRLAGGLRYMRTNPDGGGSWTVSIFPSKVFDILLPVEFVGRDKTIPAEPPLKESFQQNICTPSAKHTNTQKKMKYTVWTSCGYDSDGWHSYEGPPEKTFDSSFATLEEANQRVEYVFYYKNPWGFEDEDELPYAETDDVTTDGFRFLDCRPDDSERWTVSIIPSVGFDYMNI